MEGGGDKGVVFWGNGDKFTETGGTSSLRRGLGVGGGGVGSCAEGGASEGASVLVRGEEMTPTGGEAVGDVVSEEGGVWATC